MKKRVVSIFLAAAMVLSVSGVTAFASSEEQGYLKIGDKEYRTAEEIKSVTDGESTVLQEGDVIEVYGKVDLPLHTENQPNLPTAHGGYVWYLAQKGVKVVGKTADATLYSSADANADELGGMGGRQTTIIVAGEDVVFENVTVMPNYNTYYAPGNSNKTIEVMAKNFTIQGCTFAPFEQGAAKTADGGSLYLNGEKGEVRIENNTFKQTVLSFDSVAKADSIQVEGNTFDTPADADTQFISNVTWTNPPTTTMADVHVKGNTFKNMPEDYDKAVLSRMEGKFILEDNQTDNGKSMAELVSFDNRFVDYKTLSEKAPVIVIENGKTTELAVSEDGSAIKDTVVSIDITGIQLDKEAMELTVGATAELKATVLPADATVDKTITWASSDEAVATVKEGKVTAVKEGKATITATAGGKSASCTISVSAAPAEPTPTPTPDLPKTGEHGTALPMLLLLAGAGVLTASLALRKRHA